MSKFDLSEIDFQDLVKLRNELDASIDSRREMEKQQLLQEIRQRIAERGFTIAEIFGGDEITRNTKSRPPVAPKYHNPNNPDQKWSGRGRKPGWVLALLQEGRSMNDLLIEGED
uniref:DNA-binding protein H-NS n=2 Tax=unclassified Candidatus Kentrum TaxID=2643149 RepID=A0A451ATT1_9GAMM|nr:MAG: DNA-binding protein H-NS [Candidatus Kentron sp. LPFa]VFK09528.1 MAG: DNA-binding protein H-NS [Candidatus Kentron sp. LPFa]VFK25125.1 MAG: DNA-binding protein H-NS [Candidatus Kentron sp. LPFa]VFK60738.1 MAG: DNA-binding protein H-NS [Candidatus Kentron sp. UNK]VFK69448.1 MAG: DNA-binding protein H-NS [Candidatus Kentron sp. UNK]